MFSHPDEGDRMYNEFSEVYDRFMSNIDYEKWCGFIEEIWRKYDLKPELVLDLACGTGNFTLPLSEKGYDMIGVDGSPAMLAMAKDKVPEDSGILFLCQDMREFELYGTVDACICMVDGLNYLLEEQELLQVFRLVKNYLNPGGIFIFDMNTIYKFKEIMNEGQFCDTDENAAIIWESYYDENDNENTYCVTIFIEDGETGLYERHEEEHYQRGYKKENVEELIAKAGLEILGVYGGCDDLDFEEYSETCEKMFFAVRKN